jgi:hypothetical protein
MGRRRWDLGGAARDEHGDRVLEDERRLRMPRDAQRHGVGVVAVEHAAQLLATLESQRDRLPPHPLQPAILHPQYRRIAPATGPDC